MSKSSSGGSKSNQQSTQTSTTNPWGPIEQYLKQGYSEGQRLYTLGPQKYTPWSQVANFNSNQLGAMNGIENFVNSAGTQKMLGDQQSAVNGLLSGGNNVQGQLGNAFAGNLLGNLTNNNQADTSGALNRFMYQDTTDAGLQNNVNQAAGQARQAFADLPSSGIQNRFGIRDSVMNGLTQKNTNSTINQMLGNGFNLQDAMRNGAIGLANQQTDFKNNLMGGLLRSRRRLQPSIKRIRSTVLRSSLEFTTSIVRCFGSSWRYASTYGSESTQ